MAELREGEDRFKDVRTGERRETSINRGRDDEAQEALEIYDARKTGRDDSRMSEGDRGREGGKMLLKSYTLHYCRFEIL